MIIFSYFCRQCWQFRHNNDVHLRNHKPLTRNSKSQQQVYAANNHVNNNHSAMYSSSLSTGSSSGSSMGSNPSSPGDSVSSILNFQMK